jgi:hypothetical protein
MAETWVSHTLGAVRLGPCADGRKSAAGLRKDSFRPLLVERTRVVHIRIIHAHIGILNDCVYYPTRLSLRGRPAFEIPKGLGKVLESDQIELVPKTGCAHINDNRVSRRFRGLKAVDAESRLSLNSVGGIERDSQQRGDDLRTEH